MHTGPEAELWQMGLSLTTFKTPYDVIGSNQINKKEGRSSLRTYTIHVHQKQLGLIKLHVDRGRASASFPASESAAKEKKTQWRRLLLLLRQNNGTFTRGDSLAGFIRMMDERRHVGAALRSLSIPLVVVSVSNAQTDPIRKPAWLSSCHLCGLESGPRMGIID